MPNSRPSFEGRPYGWTDDGCIYGFKPLHSDYINGRLTEAEMRAVDLHQASCRKCNNSLAAHLEEFESTLIAEDTPRDDFGLGDTDRVSDDELPQDPDDQPQ